MNKQMINNILNRVPALICEFNREGRLNYVNDRYCEYFGFQREDLIGKLFFELIPESDWEICKQIYLSITPEKPIITYVHELKINNQLRWIEWQNSANFDENNILVNYYSIGTDITERRRSEEEERNELARLRSFIESLSVIMLLIEPDTGRILDANPAAVNFYGYSKDELLDMNIGDISMQSKEKISEICLLVKDKTKYHFKATDRLKNGEIKIVDVYTNLISFNQEKFLLSITFDVTDKEEAKKEINHLAYHDYLTGVFNRRYFEESFDRLNTYKNGSLAIIIGDINGFKIVNDKFGRQIGDQIIKKVAKDIQSIIGREAILARLGGDEFVILLTKTSEPDVLKLTNLLEDTLEKYIELENVGKDRVYLSVSFGYGIQSDDIKSLSNLMRIAESHVHRRKYYNENSMRSHMIKAMMSTLFQKSEREEKHSKRVSKYCEAVAKILNWNQEMTNQIRVAGSFHDIGKIGIHESILNKEGKLDEIEWELMKQHPIKSAEILEETIQYNDIGTVVAAHHERWDGTGYPKGIQGEEIPLMARIIAVADSFDAMTEQRSYRESFSKEEAITELIKCSGTQFDPDIVELFVNQVLIKEDI